MTTNLSPELQEQIRKDAKAEAKKMTARVPVFRIGYEYGHYDGAELYAEKWVEEKELRERYEKEHADLNLALAAMLNGYQNLSMDQKEWFTVPKDLIDCYTKMVLEYEALTSKTTTDDTANG